MCVFLGTLVSTHAVLQVWEYGVYLFSALLVFLIHVGMFIMCFILLASYTNTIHGILGSSSQIEQEYIIT